MNMTGTEPEVTVLEPVEFDSVAKEIIADAEVHAENFAEADEHAEGGSDDL
jgi:hypothetical protein